MLWTNVRSWAKDQGYHTSRKKISDNIDDEHHYQYDWYKMDDPMVNGQTSSAGRLATAIYNHMTNNAHVEYQEKYKKDKASTDINHNEISG
jgi:hypothetical protein